MKIYLVVALSGSHEDSSLQYLGVFSDKEVANKIKVSYEKEMNKKKTAPFPEILSNQGFDDCINLPENRDEENWKILMAWDNDKYDGKEFSGCLIEEFELNKPLC